MKPLGSVAAVIAAIREDASAEAEALDGRALAELERIRALEASDVVTIPDRESRLAAARQQAQARLAQEDWEDTREAVADREQWLARALELGQKQLANPEDAQTRRERLAAFAREGLSRLPGRVCEVVVPKADVALLGPEWRNAVADAGARDEVEVIAGPVDGGCVVRTPDRRASFDNSYAGRARRFQAAWRSALAELYEQGISAASASADPTPGD
jgi:vacuolar-type H+-ATPase subunit E/Vma4